MDARRADRRARHGVVPLLWMMLVLGAPLSACDSEPPPPPAAHLGEFVRHPAPPLDSLRAAPETVRVGYELMAADAELYFLPGGTGGPEARDGPAATPLTGLVYLRRVDSLPPHPPAGVALHGAWLRAGDSTGALRTAQDAPGFDGVPPLTHSVEGGPAWLRRDDTVDVVIRVRYADGTSKLVQKRRVHVYVPR